MPTSSKNESVKIKELENLSRIDLVKEIDKLEPSEESKKKKITSSLLLKGKKRIGFKPKKKQKKKVLSIKKIKKYKKLLIN